MAIGLVMLPKMRLDGPTPLGVPSMVKNVATNGRSSHNLYRQNSLSAETRSELIVSLRKFAG